MVVEVMNLKFSLTLRTIKNLPRQLSRSARIAIDVKRFRSPEKNLAGVNIATADWSKAADRAIAAPVSELPLNFLRGVSPLRIVTLQTQPDTQRIRKLKIARVMEDAKLCTEALPIIVRISEITKRAPVKMLLINIFLMFEFTSRIMDFAS